MRPVHEYLLRSNGNRDPEVNVLHTKIRQGPVYGPGSSNEKRRANPKIEAKFSLSQRLYEKYFRLSVQVVWAIAVTFLISFKTATAPTPIMRRRFDLSMDLALLWQARATKI